jgi:undecaprenyl-diphosphatase
VTDVVPGRSQLGPLVDAFDAAADELLERLRGHPLADRLFLAASHVGDFSLIWHVVGITRGLIRHRPDQVLALAAGLGIESLVVNQGVKRLIRRPRPTLSGDHRLTVRTPSTSAFPSGHASSAAFAAATLIAWDGRRWAPPWVIVAAVVGTSRAYVRIHHPSDVVGGAVIGLVLAALLRPVIQRFAPR